MIHQSEIKEGTIVRTTLNPEAQFKYLGCYQGRAKLETISDVQSTIFAPIRIMVSREKVFALDGDQPPVKKAVPSCAPTPPAYKPGDTIPAPSLPGAISPGTVDHFKAAMKAKDTNPKQLYGDKKPPLHLIHMIAQLHESAAMHAGRRKYGENNFLASKIELMTYIGAILRHTLAYAAGERADQKELVHHLGAVRACCNILLTAEATGVLIDNRPETLSHPKFAEKGALDFNAATQAAFKEVEGICEHLNALYPNLL